KRPRWAETKWDALSIGGQPCSTSGHRAHQECTRFEQPPARFAVASGRKIDPPATVNGHGSARRNSPVGSEKTRFSPRKRPFNAKINMYISHLDTAWRPCRQRNFDVVLGRKTLSAADWQRISAADFGSGFRQPAS
ncbi:MAG TPA: hypothetical protein VJX94_05285, partial [Stellaceae bacterium]|nr:hypothetical protein [Stellaceae bacterium]